MLSGSKGYQKSIGKSVRLSQPVYDYIMQAPGEGFNQKFENIILDAKESEVLRKREIALLDDRIQELDAEYSRYRDQLRKLEPLVQAALHINSLIRDLNNSFGDYMAAVRSDVSQ